MFKFLKNLFGKPQSGNPEGISEFKSLIKTGLEISIKIKDAKADGKIKGIEWIGIAQSAAPLINNIKNWGLLKAQALDLTTEEGIELAEYATSLGIIKENANEVIYHVISAIEKSYGIYVDHVSHIIRILRK
jgi:hypothetical protein